MRRVAHCTALTDKSGLDESVSHLWEFETLDIWLKATRCSQRSAADALIRRNCARIMPVVRLVHSRRLHVSIYDKIGAHAHDLAENSHTNLLKRVCGSNFVLRTAQHRSSSKFAKSGNDPFRQCGGGFAPTCCCPCDSGRGFACLVYGRERARVFGTRGILARSGAEEFPGSDKASCRETSRAFAPRSVSSDSDPG